jgi:hypothetical protein
MVLGSGCAQIGMPLGGPRDSLPPNLILSDPPNFTTNFSANKIQLTFDEYIHIEDIQNNLLVSPTPKVNPVVNYRLKTVSIKLKDSLLENTTYSIQLGNSIQDINENNPVRNFTYVFSTGNHIDSLTFTGKVILAETGQPDSTLLVLLYKVLSDSAVYKHKPVYISRVDSSGNFRFRYIAAGTYNVFALKDESGQKVYNNPSQLFAFADSTVSVPQEKPVQLYAYAEQKTAEKTAALTAGKDKNLTFSNSLNGGIQDLLTPLTLTFSNKLKDFDSARIALTDTLFAIIPSTATLDTSRKVLKIASNWTEDFDYNLLVEKDAVTDTSGNQLAKADTLRFKTAQESNYGSIRLTFTNLQKFAHPVLQFVSNNEVVASFPIKSPVWEQKLFKPGDYTIRILDDENENGVWDPGNYHKRKQPEKAVPISQKITIRGNWENERDIIL